MDHRPVRTFIQVLPRGGYPTETTTNESRHRNDEIPKRLTRLQRAEFGRHLLRDKDATTNLTSLQTAVRRAATHAAGADEPTAENEAQRMRKMVRTLKAAYRA